MKTRFQRLRKLATALVVLPLLTACYNQNAQSTNATAPVVTTAAVAPAPATNAPAKAEPVIKQVFDVSTLNLSPGLADVIKLAQSGVSAEVMSDFVAKSPHAYKLTADEIIYLNDLGIPSNVISAMLRKELPAVAAPAPAPASVPVAETAPPPPAQPAQPAQPAAEAAAAQPAAATTTVVQPVYVTQPAQTVTYQYFYDSLAPYGTWFYVADYGYCWRPTVAVINVGWRPYCHGGRWLYTDYGWYWSSDYTWGWAPFHYGRWHLHGVHGWVWVPDTCWGPSWVTWRYSAGYYGWAPLPPAAHWSVGVGFTYHGGHVGVGFGFGLGHSHYTFVPSHRFYDRNFHSHVVSAHESQTIYNNSTVINNYINGDNNTIVNKGIAREEVVRHTKADIPTLAVRDLPANSPANLRPDRVARDGDKQVVYRQALPQRASLTSGEPVRAPAPAVAALARDTRSASTASLAGGRAGTPNAYTPPERKAGATLTAPASAAPSRPSVSRAVESPAGSTPSATTTRPTPKAYEPPKSATVAPAPVAPAAPTISTPGRETGKSSTPSYTPPARSTTTPSTPSYTPPSRSTTTPATPGYTPPARSEPAKSATPATPSYTPPARSTTTTPDTTPRRNADPYTPSYTPPARSEPTRSVTPSTPSYTPPARSTTTPAAPSTPSYTPPTRSTTTTPSASYTPPTPTYTPPTRSAPTYYTPSTASSTPTPSYTPPTRTYSTPAPSSSTTYTAPTRSVSPPATRTYTAPSAPSYSPPARSYSAPSAPSYSPPARSASPSVSVPSAPARSGGVASGSEGKRSR